MAQITVGAQKPQLHRLILSLPNVHCAACIGQIETGLLAVAGVRSARVNLTQKNASVDVAEGLGVDQLVSALADLGHEAHAVDTNAYSLTQSDRQGRDLLMRLAVAGFSMMNVMLLSVAVWSGADDAARHLFYWISALISVPTIAFSGQPFFRSAFASLRAGRVGMDVPISLAIILATVISVSETAQGGEYAWFDAAVTLTFFLLAGRYLDHRTRLAARSAAAMLSGLAVPMALRIGPDGPVSVDVADVVPGELVLVRPGGRMPVDGVVAAGQSEVDRAILTGETTPAFVSPGSCVAAGETNLTGPLTVRVTHAGRDSSLHRMADLVAVAEAARGRYSSLADHAARIYVPLVHSLALATFMIWWAMTGDARLAINIAAAVLIITCPCALGLAVPAVAAAASGHLFRAGLLIKNGTAIERLAAADVVVFDKTGTLTFGVPNAVDFAKVDRQSNAIALALADASNHPLACALRDALRNSGVAPANLTNLREVAGSGIIGMWRGVTVRLGRAEWLGVPPAATTATYLQIGQAAVVTYPFTDRLRSGATETVANLTRQGLHVMLMSGDGDAPVALVAQKIGVRDIAAGLTAMEKASRLAGMAAAEQRVLMVGDGLNDTAALATAYVSIAPASALDAARAASDIVMLGDDLTPVAEAVRVARIAVRRMRQNFAISIGYNIIAVPFALLGFATPLMSAVAMSLSSICVSLNAMRIK